MDKKIAELEARLVECDRVIEKITKIRSEVYNEVNKYLTVIERQRARWDGDLITIKRAKDLMISDQRGQKEWRERVLLRDHYTCQKCGSIDEPTCHHIIAKSTCNSDSLKWNPSNGIVLCKACHDKWHRHHDEGISISVFLRWLQEK
jgi:hypothetical protein